MPTPSRGYVLDGVLRGRGRFQVDNTGRSVMSFHVTTSCGEISVPRIPIAGGTRFTFAGQVGGPARVTIDGAFLSALRVRGLLRVRSPGCDTGVITLTARLS
jgi:hypothetical protein